MGQALTSLPLSRWLLLVALHAGGLAHLVIPYPENRTRISVVYKSHKGDGALISAWHLKRYEKQYPTIEVFYKELEPYPMDAKTVFFELEEPNRIPLWIPSGPASPENLNKSRVWASKAWLTLTLCPYTADWVNDVLLRRPARSALWLAPEPSLKPAWIPFRDRKLDCIYAGHAYLWPIQVVLNTVFTKYNYEWLLWKAKGPKWAKARITAGIINPAKKLAHVGNARVTLVHNSLGMDATKMQSLIDNRAFSVSFNQTLRDHYQQHFRFVPVPQIKGRMFEAALAGSLMVVWRDHHNVVEMFFEPEEEFIYFSTAEEFEAILLDVKAHPEKYEPIAKRAQERAEREYGPDQLMERVVMPAVLQVMRRHNMSLAEANATRQPWPVTSQRKWGPPPENATEEVPGSGNEE